jgi:hypothetical protein
MSFYRCVGASSRLQCFETPLKKPLELLWVHRGFVTVAVLRNTPPKPLELLWVCQGFDTVAVFRNTPEKLLELL